MAQQQYAALYQDSMSSAGAGGKDVTDEHTFPSKTKSKNKNNSGEWIVLQLKSVGNFAQLILYIPEMCHSDWKH